MKHGTATMWIVGTKLLTQPCDLPIYFLLLKTKMSHLTQLQVHVLQSGLLGLLTSDLMGLLPYASGVNG